MAMGTRKKRERQEDLWFVSSKVVGPPAHAFYDRLNQILDHHHFDRRLEQLCRRYYKGRLGRPSITPGVARGSISASKSGGRWIGGIGNGLSRTWKWILGGSPALPQPEF